MTAPPALAPPFSLVALDTVDSTNDEAKRLARAGRGDGTVVWARAQTAGRGRRGRAWVSPRGNLHVSFLIDPGRPLAEAAQLGFVAAVALVEALSALAPGLPFACKWPNDVWLGERKLAGMLLETADPLLVLGIGVDVAEAPDPALVAATSLRAAGVEVGAEEVLTRLSAALAPWLARWRAQGFAPVRAAWLARARGLGRPIEVRLDDRVQAGVFAGLDEAGALLLELPGGGIQRVLAGDVFFPGA